MSHKPFIALLLKTRLPAAGLLPGGKGRRRSRHKRIAPVEKVKVIRKAAGPTARY